MPVHRIILFGGLFAWPALAAPLQLTTESYPPYNYLNPETRQVEGVSVDIVRELMARARQAYSITLLPWQRAISLAQQQSHTCVFSMSRTPERETRYAWIGPLVANDWTLFARSDRLLQLNELEDARPFRIGSYQGDAIVQYLRDRQFSVDVAVRDESNPRKLLAQHIDLWATGRLIGLHLLQQQQISGIVPVLTFHRTEMYLACNRKLTVSQQTRFNALLRQMERDGSIARIYSLSGYSR